MAMFDNLHLTNMLRSEVESVPETGLPLDAFPDKIQEIILNLARYENFYWYTQEDVDRFLRRFHYDAFAIGDELPKQEGGG
ncbi:hypothetical protein E7X23_25580, partial [Bacteroides fragilis]